VLGSDASMEHLFINSAIIHAHQRSNGNQEKLAVRKSAACAVA
jgi:hypothetical protein